MATLNTVTSSTRPASPAAGEAYFETDTNKIIVWTGSEWTEIVSDTGAGLANADEIHYSGGLFTNVSAPYYISTAPKMHFDAAILDGADSANNPSNGSSISAWGDRSGQATSYDGSQSTGSSQPSFNVSGADKYVSFDGGDFLNLANSINRATTEAWTIIQVGNAATSTSIYHIAPNVGSSYGSIQTGVYINGQIYIRGNSIATGVDYSPLNVFTVTRNSSNTVEAFRDGNSSEGSIATTNTFVFDSIGPSGGSKTTGNIYECLFFDSILSSTDLNTINSYLSNKYSGLPSLTSW